jgi:hypothetical protein
VESESFKLREQLKATLKATLKSSSSKAKVAPTRTKARSVTSKSLNSADDLNSQQSFRRGKLIRALRQERVAVRGAGAAEARLQRQNLNRHHEKPHVL